MEVEADGSQKGIDTVARTVMQVIAVHAMLVFDMADDRLNSSPSFHLALD